MKFKSIIYIFFACMSMMIINSCTDDIKIITGDENYSIIDGDKVEVHLTVNLDNSGADRVRTRDENNSNNGVNNPDYNHPGIGGGTLATTLIYQLYDEDNNPVALPNPDTNSDIIGLHQVRVEGRQFPYSDIVFTVDNDKEYTMIFWAQSGEESSAHSQYDTKGDWFYETDDLKNIIVRYDSQDESGQGQLNNTDSRDAFCAKIKFTGGKPLPNITLRRVMAQINVGFTEALWEKLQNSNVDIQSSSVWIANVGRRFNLFENKVELFSAAKETSADPDAPEGVDGADETGKGGITWPFTMGAYNINTIPAYMEYPGVKVERETDDTPIPDAVTPTPRNKLIVGEGDGKKAYEWMSMCYILAPGETKENWDENKEDGNAISVPFDHGSTVDIVNMQFYDKNGVAYNLPLTDMSNVPVRRNYRTNIIVDTLFNATVTMDAQIAPEPYDDFGVNSNGVYDGELTPGLTYKAREGMSANWGGTTYTNGFEFYVSSLQGLKWLADRSNGLDFKLRDIPQWMIIKEEWQDLSPQELLKAYEEKVLDIIFGKGENPAVKRTMLSYYDKRYAYRNKYGYRTPWTFDDCIIYLTNDLDFNDDPEIQSDWHGFSSNMSYYNEGAGNGVWYMTPNADKTYGEIKDPEGPYYYNNSQTNHFHGFKGEFNGQGYTIYNMTINNLNDFYEYSEMDGKTYGPRKLHNSAFICSAKDKAKVKDLRLYNAYITGDYNIGGFIGYHDDNTLEIVNCRFVNSHIEGAEPQRYSPSDDANVGGIAGSVHSHTIQGCQVVNSDIISTFIGGAFVGIPNGATEYSNNKVYNTNVILTELNNIGVEYGYVGRAGRNIGTIDDASFFFGTSAYNDTGSFDDDKGDSSINAFFGIKYSPGGSRAGGGSQSAQPSENGRSTVTNLPLELFPDILTKYAQRVILDSHIIGNARKGKDGMNYGLKVDITGQPDNHGTLISNNSSFEIKTDGQKEWYFTLAGSTYQSKPLDGQEILGEKYSRQNVLLVSPNGLDNVKGVYVCAGNINYNNSERHVTIKDVIIAGEPSIEYGLYLDNVKEMKLDHVAIYDVYNAFGDNNVPKGATFTTMECDFRGITNVGKGYSNVKFTNTAFNKGSGKTENVQGKLNAKSSATFDNCVFRVDYKIIADGDNVTLTFKDCICGPPYHQQKLTPENFYKYMDLENPFSGTIKFEGDNKAYSYEDLIKFKPQ